MQITKMSTGSQEQVTNILKPLQLSDDVLREIMSKMDGHATRGLGPQTQTQADLKMYITYVRSIPDGSECGDYLALDLGGTNFRVLLIKLDGDKVGMDSTIYMVPETIMKGTGEELFDHIASCIESFVNDKGLQGKQLPLGFTFSFPCKQHGLNRASLVTWTKGFNCSGVVGEDIVELLHKAVQKKNLNVKCVAVINDTVGALMSCAFEDKHCRIGLILGTGSNACYMENLARVKTWDGDEADPKQVIINCEWGAFGNRGCLDFVSTPYDKQVDETSINKGQQIYEKMISGMYMGEIARQVIVHLVEEKLLLTCYNGNAPGKLAEAMQFFTKYISEIVADTEAENYEKTKQILEELEVQEHTLSDYQTIVNVCTVVSQRAAYLAAAGIAVLLNRIEEETVTVAVDGSLYRYHPHFHNLITSKVQDLAPGRKFKLMLSNDGSGKGAALVAAVAWRLQS